MFATKAVYFSAAASLIFVALLVLTAIRPRNIDRFAFMVHRNSLLWRIARREQFCSDGNLAWPLQWRISLWDDKPKESKAMTTTYGVVLVLLAGTAVAVAAVITSMLANKSAGFLAGL